MNILPFVGRERKHRLKRCCKCKILLKKIDCSNTPFKTDTIFVDHFVTKLKFRQVDTCTASEQVNYIKIYYLIFDLQIFNHTIYPICNFS